MSCMLNVLQLSKGKYMCTFSIKLGFVYEGFYISNGKSSDKWCLLKYINSVLNCTTKRERF